MIGRLFRNKFIVISSLLLLLFAVLVVLGPDIAPYKPNAQNLLETLQPPSARHLFGTDQLGRDVLSRVIYGARYSLLIAFSSVLCGGVIGVLLGLIAGYFGGRTDDLIMRVVDVLLSIPQLLTAIVVVAILGPGITGLVVAITIAFTPTLARVTRSSVLQSVGQDYVAAGRAIGASHSRLMFLHVFPNAAAPILVSVTTSVGEAILITSALGFLGLGVQPPTPEWGAMIGTGKDYLSAAPNIVAANGLAISLAVLCFNLLGDGLRDVFDPRLRR